MSARDVDGKARGAALLPRVLVGLVGIPLLAFVALRGGWLLLILVDLLIILGLWEFYRLLETKGIRPLRIMGIGGGLFLSWQIYFQFDLGPTAALAIVVLILMAAELARQGQNEPLFHIAATLFGILYVALLGCHLIMLRRLPLETGGREADGGWYLLSAFIITWVCDTAAYGVGLALGRHPLLPRVSPKKSVEGAIGGVCGSLLAGILLGWLFLRDVLSPGHFIVIALIVGTIGQLGDLVESLLKRDAKVKDTSRILPGHGGVLDRFDSLLFAVPVIYWYLKHVAL